MGPCTKSEIKSTNIMSEAVNAWLRSIFYITLFTTLIRTSYRLTITFELTWYDHKHTIVIVASVIVIEPAVVNHGAFSFNSWRNNSLLNFASRLHESETFSLGSDGTMSIIFIIRVINTFSLSWRRESYSRLNWYY